MGDLRADLGDGTGQRTDDVAHGTMVLAIVN